MMKQYFGVGDQSDTCWRKVKTKRRQIVCTLCIYAMFIVLGWIRGLFGPSFLDLLIICNATLELGSWIAASFYIGYAAGTLCGGLVYDKTRGEVIYGACMLALSVLTAVTPWCSVFGLMVAAHCGQGVTFGMTIAAANADILRLWPNNRILYFCLKLMFDIGTFVAPVVVAPFLLYATENERAFSNNSTSRTLIRNVTEGTDNFQNMFTTKTFLNDSELTYIHIEDTTIPNVSITSNNMTLGPADRTKTSRLYIPYTISAAVGVCVFVAFLIMFVIQREDTNMVPNVDEDDDIVNTSVLTTARTLPPKLRMLSLVLLSSLLMIFQSLADSFSAYLAVFCVTYLNWSAADSAVINSVTNFCGIVAAVVALFSACLNTLIFTGVNVIGTVLGMASLLVSSLHNMDIGIWLSSGVVGYFKAMVFSLIFTWTNEYVTPVSGAVSSLYLLTTCVGSTVNTVILGWLMEDYSNLWFCYLFLIQGIVVLFLYISGLWFTKYIVRHYGRTHSDRDQTFDGDTSVTENLGAEEQKL